MATSAPAIAVRQPKAPAVQIVMPAAIISIIADTPQTMQAPERSAGTGVSLERIEELEARIAALEERLSRLEA